MPSDGSPERRHQHGHQISTQTPCCRWATEPDMALSGTVASGGSTGLSCQVVPYPLLPLTVFRPPGTAFFFFNTESWYLPLAYLDLTT